MRTIKFRGKGLDGEWVFGYYLVGIFGNHFIRSIADSLTYEVDPDTVGQFTGVFDCEGREIYEGDIVILATNDKYTPWPSKVITVSRCKVVFYPQLSSFVMETIIEDEDPDQHGEYTHFGAIEIDSVEVIGNIYDDPEMLKGGAR